MAIEPSVEPNQIDRSTGGFPSRYFEPVDDELDTMELPVQGTIPPELDGSYVRNGPNAQFARSDGWQYPYDGDGMIHVVTLVQSRARYRNRYVLTKDLVEERRVGHSLHTGTFDAGVPAPGPSDPDLAGDGPVGGV